MLKKRLLLLAASVTAVGAMLVGGAFAQSQNTGSADTDPSDPVSVQSVQGDVNARLHNQVSEIPANDLPHKVADIQAHKLASSEYEIWVTDVEVTDQGSMGSGCVSGTWHSYAIDWSSGIGTYELLTTSWQNIANLMLAINWENDENCTVSGAVVTLDYEVTLAP